MPFSPNSSSCSKKLSSEYQPYACGNFSGHSLILEKIAILGQPPRAHPEMVIFRNLCVRFLFTLLLNVPKTLKGLPGICIQIL